jgi:hypothetical protein
MSLPSSNTKIILRQYKSWLQSAILYWIMIDIVRTLMNNQYFNWPYDEMNKHSEARRIKFNTFRRKRTNNSPTKEVNEEDFWLEIATPVNEYINQKIVPHYKNRFISSSEITTFITQHTSNNQQRTSRSRSSDIANCLLGENEYARGLHQYLSAFLIYIKYWHNVHRVTVKDLIKIESIFITKYIQEKKSNHNHFSRHLENPSSFKRWLLEFSNNGYPICKRLSTSAAQEFLTYLQKK